MRLYSQTNVPTEVSFAATMSYDDIFNDVEVDVIFTGPDGRQWTVPAFWAGDNVFRVRFAAPKPGVYAYRSICTNSSDSGLHDATGELEATPYSGKHHLYRHGHLRVAANSRTLEHVDGTPFFWMGDTWWMGLTTRLDWPHGFKQLAADRAAKGFNLVQIVAGPLPDFDAETAAWHPQQANEAGWSWEQGWTRINPGYYDLADLRIAHLVESGLTPCIVGMWGYYLSCMGVEKAKKHWRNLIARYGAYPVIWCVAGEVIMPTYSHHPNWGDEPERLREGWTEVTRYVRAVDPYSSPVSAHAGLGGESRDMLTDESLIDLVMHQTGHSSYNSLKPSVDAINASIARQPRMPVVNSEVCYEGIMGGSRQEVQRFLFWTSLTSGSAGHTYGAQGIWAMSSRDEPFDGTTTSWGDGYWQDVMHYAGSGQVALGRRFFERYHWPEFEPLTVPEVEAAGRLSSFATGIPGKIAVFYLAATCMEDIFWGVQGLAITVDPGSSYTAYFFNPRTGVEISVSSVNLDALGRWPVPAKPTMEDWVLVLENEGTASPRC